MKKRGKTKVYSALAVLFAFLTVTVSGCGSQQAGGSATGEHGADVASASSVKAELPDASATDYLKQVLSRYRSTQSYRDRGEVRLRVEKDGRMTRRTAPMHVVLDESTIWVAAYDARLWSDSGKTMGWIADEQSSFHDSQVVVGGSAAAGPSSVRPILGHLLRDPILTTRMTAGLGGPPPQLEWLLDPDPMAKLFRDEGREARELTRKIEYEGLEQRDQIECVVVRAVVGEDLYRFWIERNRSLVHCVELPVSMAGEQIELDGWKVHSLELVLVDASFDPPENAYQLSAMPLADLPRVPKYVRALVPLPPPEPNRRLGSLVAKFSRPDLGGRIEVTQRGADRTYTLYYASLGHRVVDSERRNLHAVNQLSTLLQQQSELMRASVRPICLVDDQSARMLVDAGLARSGWLLLPDRDASVRGLIGVEPGQAVLVDSSGQILWVGTTDSPSGLVSLGAVLADAHAGVDVPAQIRRVWASDRKAYRKKLAELAVQ